MSIADIYAKKNDDDLADDLAYFACEGGGTVGSRSVMFEAARRLRDRPAPAPTPADAFDAAVGRVITSHADDLYSCVRDAARIAAREDRDFVGAGLDLYAVITRLGMRDDAAREIIREGWEAGLSDHESAPKGGDS